MLALMSPLIATAAMTAPSIVRTTPCASFASTAARLPSRAVAAPRMVLDDIFNIAGTAAVDSVLQDLTTADSLLRSMPITGWTLLACMLTLGIGQTFEYTIHNIRHAVSSSLLPVVEAILGELTVIGFSGLLLGTIQAGSEDSLFGRFSEHYLGDAHELFELLEGVEHALFPTTVAFVSCS